MILKEILITTGLIVSVVIHHSQPNIAIIRLLFMDKSHLNTAHLFILVSIIFGALSNVLYMLSAYLCVSDEERSYLHSVEWRFCRV